MAVRLSTLRAGRPLPPWYSFLLEAESISGAIVRLEGLGQLKNLMFSSGIEPACSIVPQPNTVPRAPQRFPKWREIKEFTGKLLSCGRITSYTLHIARLQETRLLLHKDTCIPRLFGADMKLSRREVQSILSIYRSPHNRTHSFMSNTKRLDVLLRAVRTRNESPGAWQLALLHTKPTMPSSSKFM
jgi:hypothetical protein